MRFSPPPPLPRLFNVDDLKNQNYISSPGINLLKRRRNYFLEEHWSPGSKKKIQIVTCEFFYKKLLCYACFSDLFVQFLKFETLITLFVTIQNSFFSNNVNFSNLKLFQAQVFFIGIYFLSNLQKKIQNLFVKNIKYILWCLVLMSSTRANGEYASSLYLLTFWVWPCC